MPPAAGGASFPPVITHKEGQPYRQHFAPARCRSGSRDEVPLSSKTLVRYCAQLPVPDCKSGRVAHKVCKPQGYRPACRKSGRLPPDRQGAGAGYGFELFAAQKSQNRSLISISLLVLSAVLAAGCCPVVIQRRKRWPPERTRSAARQGGQTRLLSKRQASPIPPIRQQGCKPRLLKQSN